MGGRCITSGTPLGEKVDKITAAPRFITTTTPIIISIKMGVEKKTISNGDGVTFPKVGDNVALHYTGCLYDASKADNHCMGTK